MPKSILLVDDDLFFRTAIADGLRAAAYEVTVAGDGLEALEQVRHAPPDVILLDLIMPKLDGIRTCKLLKRNPQHRSIPIIILTGAGREGLQALNGLGAEATVVKRQAEATLAELLRTLQRLEAALPEAQPPLEAPPGLAERRIVSELLAERRHTQTLLDTLGEGVVELDEQGHVVYVNPAALAMVELPEEVLLGTPGPSFLGPANAPTLALVLAEVRSRSGGEPIRLELLHGCKVLGVTLTALRRPDGPPGALWVLSNLTALTRRAKSLEALGAVAQHILTQLDLPTVLREIVAQTAEILGVERCALFRVEGPGDGLRLRCIQAFGFPGGFAQHVPIAPGEGVIGRAVAERRPVHTTDVLQDPAIRLSEPLRSLARAERIEALLAAPILLPDEVFGSLAVYRPAGHQFTPEEVDLAKSLAGLAALAIENARLYADSQRRAREAGALAEVGRVLSTSLDMDRILDLIVQEIQRVMEVPFVGVMRLDEARQELAYVKGVGLSPERLAQVRLKVGEGIAGAALAQGVPLQSPRVLQDPRFVAKGIVEGEGFRSVLCVPLLAGGRSLGVLVVFRQEVQEFPPGEVQLLNQFAEQAALAMENARLYAEARTYSEELEQKVAERTRELQILNRELETASRHKSEFLANMSHELRTPLHGAIGFTELLLGLGGQAPGPLNPKQEHYLQAIRTSGRRLLELIDDMLDLAKIEAGRMTLDPKEVSVQAALHDAVTPAKLQALQKGLTLDLDLAEMPETLVADARKLQQILGNLLANAIKFTPAGGRISVAARPVPDPRGWALEAAVGDTGIGIAPEDQARLFREFEQLDHSLAKRHQGTGLGLALAKRLVRLHRGRIWAASAGRGKGATFTFRLPCRPEPLCGTVLVVEDDGEARTVLREVLTGCGLQVHEAVDALQGLALIEAAVPDVLVLDLRLPFMDGHRVIQNVRARPQTAGLPILVVTGLDAEDGRVAVAQGADAYLLKPFTAEALTEAIEQMLERRSAAAPVQP